MCNHTTKQGRARLIRAVSFFVILLLAVACQTVAGENPVGKEWQIKAAFLYNFPKFIEWPAEKLPKADSPLIIGVLGKNPFGDELEKAAKDRKINGREIIVRRVRTAEEIRSVHVLFISAVEGVTPAELAGALKAGSVLGVGDSSETLKQGAAIGFVVEGDKVRFELDLGSADDARVKISAHLQKLAKTIRKRS